MSALSEPCPSYEPHFWKMGKCKNCFFSRAEHKRYRKELQADDDASSAGDVSPHESVDGDSGRLQLKRREARDEMKQLRKERKALASKHSELRDTMMTMEAQMLDYKETKQENDILTKDMKLLRKDLHEITAGAARACEQNELLRQEAAMLRLCLEENGVEAPVTLLDARFQLQPDSPYSSSRAASPRPDSRRETKKEAPEGGVPSLKLAAKGMASGLLAQQQPLSRATGPIVAEIDASLAGLRHNCATILRQCDDGQAVVSLNFVLGMLQALERQSAAAADLTHQTSTVSKESIKESSKGVNTALSKKKEKEEKGSANKEARGEEAAPKEEAGEEEGEESGLAERGAKEEGEDSGPAEVEATDTESGESESKSKSKRVKKASRESKSRSKHASSSDSKRAAKVRPKKSIGGKLVAGLKKRASLSVPKLSACSGDAATMEEFAAYLADQGQEEDGRFLALLRAADAYAALSSSAARAKAFRALCDAHVGDEGPPLASDLRTALLEARAALDEEEKAPGAALVERAAAASRARLEGPFRTFSLRGSS